MYIGSDILEYPLSHTQFNVFINQKFGNQMRIHNDVLSIISYAVYIKRWIYLDRFQIQLI